MNNYKIKINKKKMIILNFKIKQILLIYSINKQYFFYNKSAHYNFI